MGKAVFDAEQVFIIAEAGVNHNGDRALAKQLIDAAAEAGADAVKFQLFEPEKLTSKSAPLATYQKAEYQQKNDAEADSQQALLQKLALPREAFKELQQYANSKNILFLCTPFDEDSARYLVDELQLPCLKISSGEVTNLPFLQMLAELNTPVILSTGMSTLDEVRQAVDAFTKNTMAPLGLMHCVSAYPAPDEAVNLNAIETLRHEFPQCVIGYSDHTLGLHISLAAVALGAQIIEKHFTLDKSMPGPDHKASLSVEELKALVCQIRAVESALGDGIKQPQPVERDCLNVARKSLVAARDLPAGHVLEKSDIAIKRPGTGISPALLDAVLGQKLAMALEIDELLPESLIRAIR